MSHFFPPLFHDLHNNIVIVAGQSHEYSQKDNMKLLSPFSPLKSRRQATSRLSDGN